MKLYIICALSIFCLASSPGVNGSDADGVYKVGTGIGDITGPPAGVVLNGYVNPLTYAAGIHTRQFARTFLVESLDTQETIVYVTCDLGMMDHSIKAEVIEKLQALYGATRFTEKNVMLSATHSHSGPSGFMTYYAYLIIESYGFNPLSFWSIVDGVVESIQKAMDNGVQGRLFFNKGRIENLNHNRQENAYNANPDKDLYADNVDKEMVLLKIESLDEEPLGAFTWWPVHPISFNGGLNPLVSSDNKGYAALLFDYEMNPGQRPGFGKFVSGFGSSNLGDVNPSTDGMDGYSSVRINVTDDLAGTRWVGMKQFEKAMELFNDKDNLQAVTGPIKFAHQFVDTDTVEVPVTNPGGEPETLRLCKASLGYSYVGLDPAWSAIWDFIRNIIHTPTDETIECQKPKLIALPAGEMTEPWQWAPSIMALQILQIGNFDIVGSPGEYTTMSGRRVRNAVFNITNHEVVIAGLANNYINYIATPEEYDVQEYEGGATIYGRNTLPVTIAIFEQMAHAIIDGTEIPEGTPPPSFLDKVRSEIDQKIDIPLRGRTYGSVAIQPKKTYKVGDEMNMYFVSASPRASPIRGGTFLTIERQQEDGSWEIVRTDADVDTTFHWSALFDNAQIKWVIGSDTTPGTYRVRHFGYHLKQYGGRSSPYAGTSNTFQVTTA